MPGAGVTVGGHDLNADPQEMKHRTYYLSNGTIRVAGKLVTRCAEPYAEGDVVTVQMDLEQHHISFLKNGVLQGAGDGLPGGYSSAQACLSRRPVGSFSYCIAPTPTIKTIEH